MIFSNVLNIVGFVGVWIFTVIGVLVAVAPIIKYILEKKKG